MIGEKQALLLDMNSTFMFGEDRFDAHRDCLLRLSRTHQLGLVSNIWARKAAWLAEFERAGIRNIWRTVVFSSDSRSIKPSLRLFHQALAAFDSAPCEVVFVGDNLRVDIEPAKALGLATVWITAGDQSHPRADRIVPTLLALESLPAACGPLSARSTLHR